MQSSVEILQSFARLLQELGIRYVVVGSFASSARGQPRATMDADVVAEINRDHGSLLAKHLEADFYIDEKSIREAALSRGSFNAIHFETSFKIDIYVAKPGGFDEQQLLRRIPESLDPDSVAPVYIATAEDTILAKLVWFQKGGEQSNRQWSDVRGVLAVQQGTLDLEYLEKWAGILGISDLLKKVIDETL